MPRPIATTLHIDRRAHKIVARAAEEPGNDDDLLTTAEAADYLDVSPQWLAIRRGRGNGPPFIRVSARKIMYQRGGMVKWCKERTFNAISDYPRPRRARGSQS
jgi:hypothetical protein